MVGEWFAGSVESRSDDGNPPTVDSWHPVSVPGRPEQFVGTKRPVAYRTGFDDPRTRAEQRTLLQLRGVYGRATIWVNGENLGSHDLYPRPGTFEFEPEAQNDVIIVCEMPETYGGIYATEEIPEAFRVPGIWWGCTLGLRPSTYIRSFDVRPRVTDDGGEIEASVEVDARETIDESVTLSLRPEGFRGGGSMERIDVTVDEGERQTVSATLDVREPSLWWPRGYGSQHRYTIRAKLGEDSKERTIGLRTMSLEDDGLFVNGERIQARGVTRLPGGDPIEDVHAAIDVNATMIRPRAHVLPHRFYDECDAEGVLVWQDLPASGPTAGVDRATERGRELAATLSTEYGHHPSIALYGMYDEPVAPEIGPVTSGFRSRLAFRYRMWRSSYDRTSASEIAASLPEDVPIIAITGPPRIGPDATTIGTGWEYLEATDVEWLLDRYPSLGSIIGGFGTSSLVDTETNSAHLPRNDEQLIDRRCPGIEPSQSYQATVMQTIATALRRRGSDVIVASTLRDSSPTGGRGVLTQSGDRKPAAIALESSFEPIVAVLDGPPEPGKNDIVLCNDTAEDVDTTVAWRSGDETGSTSVSVAAGDTADAGIAVIPADASEVILDVSFDDETVQNHYTL